MTFKYDIDTCRKREIKTEEARKLGSATAPRHPLSAHSDSRTGQGLFVRGAKP